MCCVVKAIVHYVRYTVYMYSLYSSIVLIHSRNHYCFSEDVEVCVEVGVEVCAVLLKKSYFVHYIVHIRFVDSAICIPVLTYISSHTGRPVSSIDHKW